MARYRGVVAGLAQEAGLDVDDAVLILIDAGFKVESGTSVVPKSTMARARAALGLPATPCCATRCEVVALAERAGKDESSARELLFSAHLLVKRRHKRV